jgi:starch phosphorylase
VGRGYDGDNGFGIKPASPELEPHRRDREEARTLYEILQDRVVPLYYQRPNSGANMGYSPNGSASPSARWPRSCRATTPRACSASTSPSTTCPHRARGAGTPERGYEGAKSVAQWKARVRAAWPGRRARRLDTPKTRIQFGDSVPVEIAVRLNGLAPTDVCVELLLARGMREAPMVQHSHELAAEGRLDSGEHRYRIDLKPGLSGRLDYRIRVFPRHELLTHRFELGLACWV